MSTIFGECDCCAKNGFLVRTWFMGIETYACLECRGEDPEHYPDDEGEDE